MNALLKGGNETATAALEEHASLAKTRVDLGKGLEGHAVEFQVAGIANHPPGDMTRRKGQRLAAIDDRMGHDDAVRSDGQAGVGAATQETVESHEDILAQIRLDDLGPMGGNIVASRVALIM